MIDVGTKGSVGSSPRACCHATKSEAMWNGVVNTNATTIGTEYAGALEMLMRANTNGRMEKPRDP